MKQDIGPQKLSDLFNKVEAKKPPAYQWQELALRIISDFGVPPAKKGSVFKLCKNNSQAKIERAMNDTKELCKKGESWKYFFKVIADSASANKLK